MCQFFPVLEKIPSLLVFCWLIRDFRFFRNTVFSKCSKAWFWISVRFLDLKEKMKGGGEDMKEEKEVPEEILITGNNKEKGTLRGEENV